MRIALYFNPDAGAHGYSPADLTGMLRNAGHQVELFGKVKGAMRRAVESNPAVLVAAGGDGTIAKAAIALAERAPHVPLYVLAMGTSNNIAMTLSGGRRDTAAVLVSALAGAKPARLDIGAATGPWGEQAFVEGAGVGFFGATLHNAESLRSRLRTFVRTLRRRTEGEAEVRAAARGMARLIRRLPARRYTVFADGRDLSGEYLGVEVMNVRAIGPRLWLAPDAAYGDGLLDVALVRPDDRESLARLAESGEPRDACCEVHRARAIELSWPHGDGHLDDTPWPKRDPRWREGGRVIVDIKRSIQVLRPDPATLR